MNLRLDALTREDCEEVRRWRNSDLVSWRTPFLLTKEMQEDFYDRVVCARNGPHRYWAVLDDEEDSRLVAQVGLTDLEWENGSGQITMTVGESRRGYGRACLRLLLDEAFGRMRLATVYGECYLCNPAVEFWRKMAVEYGATTTLLPRRKFWNGRLWDSLYFSFAAPDSAQWADRGGQVEKPVDNYKSTGPLRQIDYEGTISTSQFERVSKGG